METLPPEIIEQIYRCLDPHHILQMAAASKYLQECVPRAFRQYHHKFAQLMKEINQTTYEIDYMHLFDEFDDTTKIFPCSWRKYNKKEFIMIYRQNYYDVERQTLGETLEITFLENYYYGSQVMPWDYVEYKKIYNKYSKIKTNVFINSYFEKYNNRNYAKPDN